ncbi:MAG: hypothetical protein GY820_48155 [Gammaproteobacteria bacterium]|nr:hypothetical protein [Gammaproteobacteria bacterium]
MAAMNADLLNSILHDVERYVPIGANQLEDGFSTIVLENGNHWVALVKEEGETIRFDSKPFQQRESCGVFAALVVLAHGQGGLPAVRTFWDSLQEGRSDQLVIDILQKWISQ